MDIDIDLDLRWGGFHTPTKRFSRYGQINKVVSDLNTAQLRQHQRTKILKNGVYIEKSIQKKYADKTTIFDRIKRYLNPYIDKAFGCLQNKINPPSGEVIEDVTTSYVLNTTIKDFEYLDETVMRYYSDEPEPAYAVCYSFKRDPKEDLKNTYEILNQNYIKSSVKELSEDNVGSGITHLMLVSNGEERSSRSLEECHVDSLFACKNISRDTFWLTGPVSYKLMLKDIVWKIDVKKRDLYKTLKLIESFDHKIDYWDKLHLKGNEKAGKVLKNIGKFSYENHKDPYNVEFMIDLSRMFPEKAHHITNDIYRELSGRSLGKFTFEKHAEAIVEGNLN